MAGRITKTGVLLFFTLLIFHFGFSQKKKSPQPNIILILVDDQGYGDIGVFWQNQRAAKGLPHERSPNLDRMAAQGAMLTQHYCAAPVCAPSRASLILGVSQGHANVRDNQFDKALADNYNMASTLKKLGYNTVAIGKWGLQGSKRWDENGENWPARPTKVGFDYFLGYMRHSDGHEHYPKEGLYRGKKQVWHNGTIITDKLDKCYTADLWTATAKHWIVQHERQKDKDQPFFMYLAYDTPHAVDELPTQKYPAGGGLHGGLQWIGEAGHFINTASGKVDSYINTDYANATYDDDHDPSTPEVAWPETYKRYATANRRIDNAVGDILQLLKDLKIDSNTLVIYTSDNGPSIETYLGKWQKAQERILPTFFGSYGPFDGIKRDNWEGGVRMPAIAWWPGHIPQGNKITSPSINYDWAPTFIDAAGAVAPERMDGVSLLPSLTGKGKQRQSLIYIEYYQGGKTPGFKEFAPDHRNRRRNQMQNIRLGNYVGVRYNVKSAKDSFEIYNVVKDPQEMRNLALQPRKKIVVKHNNIKGGRSKERMRIQQVEKVMKENVLQVRIPSADAPRPYDSALIPPVTEKVTPGISWRFYKGDFPWIPQVAGLEKTNSGTAITLKTDVIPESKNGILFFYGYIRVPEDGAYTFYLKADNRSFLRIHDIQVIDADYGTKNAVVKKTTLFMKAGLHPFSMYYTRQKGAKGILQLEWSGPGIKKQAIAEKYLYRKQ